MFSKKFVSNKKKEEDKYERPTWWKSAASSVENKEGAKKTAKSELNKKRQKRLYPDEKTSLRRMLMIIIKENDTSTRNNKIKNHDKIVQEKINPLESQVVKDKTTNKNQRWDMSLVPLVECFYFFQLFEWILTPNNSDQKHDDGDNKKHMNKTPQYMEAQETNKPKDD